jgi:hypothetical protein
MQIINIITLAISIVALTVSIITLYMVRKEK